MVFYVYVGTTLSGVTEALSGHESFNTTSIIAMSIGIAVAIVGAVYVSYKVKRQLDQEAKKQNLAEAQIELENDGLKVNFPDSELK